MSRTRKGIKPVGFDFWSRRPKSFKNDKNLTHRAERREGKIMDEDVEDALDELKEQINAEGIGVTIPHLDGGSLELLNDGDARLSMSDSGMDGSVLVTMSDGGGFSGILMATSEWPAMRDKMEAFIKAREQ